MMVYWHMSGSVHTIYHNNFLNNVSCNRGGMIALGILLINFTFFRPRVPLAHNPISSATSVLNTSGTPTGHLPTGLGKGKRRTGVDSRSPRRVARWMTVVGSPSQRFGQIGGPELGKQYS